jgi:hypothetical protein
MIGFLTVRYKLALLTGRPAVISMNYLQVRLYVTIQVVLLVGLVVAHVTPAIKEDRWSCKYAVFWILIGS